MYFKPKEQVGLYNSAFEKDSCGVGFVAHIEGKPSRGIVTSLVPNCLQLENLQWEFFFCQKTKLRGSIVKILLKNFVTLKSKQSLAGEHCL